MIFKGLGRVDLLRWVQNFILIPESLHWRSFILIPEALHWRSREMSWLQIGVLLRASRLIIKDLHVAGMYIKHNINQLRHSIRADSCCGLVSLTSDAVRIFREKKTLLCWLPLVRIKLPLVRIEPLSQHATTEIPCEAQESLSPDRQRTQHLQKCWLREEDNCHFLV